MSTTTDLLKILSSSHVKKSPILMNTATTTLGNVLDPDAIDTETLIKRLNKFYRSEDVEATLEKLTDPTYVAKLPFPSIVTTDRIRVDETGHFTFLGRNKNVIDDIIDRIDEVAARSQLSIKGNIGGGKSNLLAVAVLRLSAKGRRIVYLSDCQAVSDNFESLLLSAIQVAYSDKDFNSNSYSFRKEDQRQYMIDFVKRMRALAPPGQHPIFICDGFNHFESMNTSTVERNDVQFLAKLANTGSWIKVISAQNSFVPQVGPNVHTIYGGLDQVEWDGWKMHYPYNRLVNQESQEKDQDDQHKLEHLSGYIPIFLSRLALYGEALSLDARLEMFSTDHDMKNFGGSWVRISLIEFATSIYEHKGQGDIALFTEMMKNSLIGRSVTRRFNPALMDHRFFYYQMGKTGGKSFVIPICGYVKEVIAQFLENQPSTQQLYFTNLDLNWFLTGIAQFPSNPSVRGFYFEKYAIAQIVLDLAKNESWSNIHVRSFPNNYPSNTQLSTDLGTYVYLPERFNHRYIDMAIRKIFRGPPDFSKSSSTAQKKGQKTIKMLEATFVQITLQTPADHLSSFNVFTKKHHEDSVNEPDYLRYLLDEDKHQMSHTIYKFLWVVSKQKPEAVLPVVPAVVKKILVDINKNHALVPLDTVQIVM